MRLASTSGTPTTACAKPWSGIGSSPSVACPRKQDRCLVFQDSDAVRWRQPPAISRPPSAARHLGELVVRDVDLDLVHLVEREPEALELLLDLRGVVGL